MVEVLVRIITKNREENNMSDLEGIKERFHEIEQNERLTDQRKGEMYAALMTRLEVENGGLNAVVNTEDMELFHLYSEISKARQF